MRRMRVVVVSLAVLGAAGVVAWLALPGQKEGRSSSGDGFTLPAGELAASKKEGSGQGVPDVTLSKEEATGAMNVEKVRAAIRECEPRVKFTESPAGTVGRLGYVPMGEAARAYLTSCLPDSVYMASGVRVLPLEGIVEECTELVPGAYLAPHGFVPIATDIGGNAIVVDVTSGATYFADHSWFSDGEAMSFKDAESGKWVDLPYDRTNLKRALVPLSADLEAFMIGLAKGEWDERLDELD